MIAYLFSNAGIRPLIPDGLKPNHKKGSLFKIMVVSYIFNQSVIMRAKERILKLSGFVLSAAVDVSVVYAEDFKICLLLLSAQDLLRVRGCETVTELARHASEHSQPFVGK